MKPSFEQYVEVGKDFMVLCDTGAHLYVRIANIFSNEVAVPLDRVTKQLNKVKSALDDCVCEEFPDRPDQEVFSVFYGERPKVTALDELPNRQHKTLTLEQYALVGTEISKFRRSVFTVACKACELHGKTKVRKMLDIGNLPFYKLAESLTNIAKKDYPQYSGEWWDCFMGNWYEIDGVRYNVGLELF